MCLNMKKGKYTVHQEDDEGLECVDDIGHGGGSHDDGFSFRTIGTPSQADKIAVYSSPRSFLVYRKPFWLPRSYEEPVRYQYLHVKY